MSNSIKHFVEIKLKNLCSVKRRAGSAEEAATVADLALYECSMIDQAGNLHFDRRGPGKSRTLFTAHTDTVHHGRGHNPTHVTLENGIQFLNAGAADKQDDVLGADDGAGLAILLTMMDQGVPGYYVFFRQEEVGGRGSEYFASEFRGLCKQFDRAIAFDRAGYGDVITRQFCGNCCSQEFAQALSDKLNNADPDFMYSPCDGGSFTDTANLVDLIPECTNLSVGYHDQHTQMESQNVTFLQQLAVVCCGIDWEDLPIGKRDPEPVFDRKYYASMLTSRSKLSYEYMELRESIEFAVENNDASEVVILLENKLGRALKDGEGFTDENFEELNDLEFHLAENDMTVSEIYASLVRIAGIKDAVII